METTLSFNLLQTIGSIYDASEGSKLSDKLFVKLNPKLEELSSYFRVTKSQAFLLANVFVFNYKGDSVDIVDLGKYFDSNPMRVLEYHYDMIELEQKGILKRKKSKHRIITIANDQFYFEEYISTAIIKNLPMPEIKPTSYTEIIAVLEKLYQLGLKRYEDNISTLELFVETQELIENHSQFPLIKQVAQMELDIEDTYFFLYLCWKTIIGNEASELNKIAEYIFDNPTRQVFYTQKYLANENELVKKGWVEITEGYFFNETEIKLTEQAVELLSKENIKLFSKKKNGNNIISPEKIGLKQLFYNQTEKRQFAMLEKMLEDENLKALQNRLCEKNLPNGIAVLLYGSPGTGKTETVFQIAKQTGREIMRVEISQSKSMWLGESEKITKRIFTDYYEFSKQCERVPILLFNEADSIISKRKDNSDSSVSRTENTIQNILLEELENFKGILFATTNLANNLDKAFERRFLFKVEFCKPDATIRAEIWKSKLKPSTIKECKLLADKFDFSGGQIDNIIRKCEMAEIINGKRPVLKEIISYCEEESISKDNHRKIGFSAKE